MLQFLRNTLCCSDRALAVPFSSLLLPVEYYWAGVGNLLLAQVRAYMTDLPASHKSLPPEVSRCLHSPLLQILSLSEAREAEEQAPDHREVL